ncbi:heme/hemin ABC transporter substrate-binding protein [Chryseolinea lacunae]|uniref:ABC transporter substrate-binding protein n=1 Tax=Chryseolinea lacunae TaxID=2801331 RepID=A0ABS1KYA3_9BACT|nr:ABC transporter substrate-binding protein [Chryseolinea lacunae]MBL0744384.1 ABC transporter substrate-binding protein [Chryseolinea lacunae]
MKKQLRCENMVLAVLFIFTSAFSFAQERIITAGSALTETVCALGDCDKIIASDRTSLYPAHIQKLPSIGYRGGIQAEGIISLKPTLIIAEKDYVEDAVLQQLRASGIKLVIVDRQYTIDDTKRFIAQIAAALGRDAEGKKLIATIDRQIADATAQLKKAKTNPKVLCIYNRGAATVSVAGKNTFGNILAYVGATSAVGDVEGYKPLNAEALLASNPEYVVTLSSGLESIGGIDGLLKVPGMAQTTAGKQRQIVSIDGLKLTNFGPRVGETIQELVTLLHPELRAK